MSTRESAQTTRRTKRTFTTWLAAVAGTVALVAASLAFAPAASATQSVKLTICHATGSESNPYVKNTVSGSSIDEVKNELLNGHGNHTGDIIPAYNGIPAQGDQSILANGCKVPRPVPTLNWVYKTAGPTQYCSHGETVNVTGEGSASWGTSRRADFDTEVAATSEAQKRADADLLKNVPRDATPGPCSAPDTVTKTIGPWDYCLNGETGQVSGTGSATYGNGGEFRTKGAAMVVALARATEDLFRQVPKGARLGQCKDTMFTVTATVGPTAYCSNGETISLTGSGMATWGTSEKAEFDNEAAAKEAAQSAAEADLASQVPAEAELGSCSDEPPEYCADGTTPVSEGCPSDPKTFTMTTSTGGSVDFCVNETENVVVEYTGSGEGTSGISTDDAFYIANQNANAAAAADLAAKTPANATKGACGAPQAVSPESIAVPEAGTVPVAAPEPAAVPETEEPAAVAVPAKGTVPTAVNAGGGATGDRGSNTGLLILALVASAVALTATGRLVATRSR